MTEADLATKAPESDAQETTPATAGEAPVEAAPKMGEHCTTDRPTPSGQASTGELTKLGGIDVYISKPADYPHSHSRFLLLLTGGTGVKSVNNQIQADKFATEGFLVVMPDLFEGDPAPNSTTVLDEPTGSILDAFKIKAAETAKSFLIDMWLARHTEEKVMPILNKVLDAAKDEFADAITSGGGVYAVGYCFGGRYVLLMAGERPLHPQGETLPSPWATQKPADEEAAKFETVGPLIKTGVIAHATLVSPGDFNGLKVPVSLVCVENDPLFPDEVRTAGEDYMTKKNVEHEVQVYPGVPHGFAVVGEYEDPNIKSAQATAFEQTLKWLKDH